jgi:uncharacterized protein (DUF2344 family)
MCEAKLEKSPQDLHVLQNLAIEPTAPNALRAQAAYELALIAQEHSQNDICLQWIKVIYELPQSTIWTEKAHLIESTLSEKSAL